MGGALVTLPALPALVVGQVSHTRRGPVRHSFTHAHFQWLVDLDALPDLRRPWRWLARFDAADHLDGNRRGGGIRGDLVTWLARRGVDVESGDRLLMLAHARSVGHVFDPLSVFWVLGADEAVRAVVMEVHNTYGERHAYLLRPDANGRARVPKEFYVSPFNDVSGDYLVRLTLDTDRVAVSVALERDGEKVFTSAVTGRPRPATPRALVSTWVRHAFLTHRVSLLIRMHGIRLWLARLTVHPRPVHSQEAVR